jgi:hypothetical protein
MNIYVCWTSGLLDVLRCYVIQVEARLYNGLYSIIDGNEIWLVIYELVFSTYCTLCEISIFLDGLDLICLMLWIGGQCNELVATMLPKLSLLKSMVR